MDENKNLTFKEKMFEKKSPDNKQQKSEDHKSSDAFVRISSNGKKSSFYGFTKPLANLASNSKKVTTISETSIQLREDGNQLYLQANAADITLSIKKKKLEAAMICFENALKTSGNDMDAAASACKNYAKTGQCLLTMCENNNSPEKKELYVKVISHFSQALYYGEKCKDNKWKDEIVVLYTNLMQEAMQNYRELERLERIAIYESFANVIVDDIYPVDLYVEIAKLLLHQALKLIEAENFNDSKIYLDRMHKPIEKIKQLQRKQKQQSKLIKESVSELEQDMTFNIGLVEAYQAIAKGDAILKENLKEHEYIRMELTYSAIDYFQWAIDKVQKDESELIVEAIATSRLGNIYDKILKHEGRAKECYKQCINITFALNPQLHVLKDWFIEASTKLDEYQQKSALSSDETARRMKEKYRKELEKEFEDLRNAFAKNSPKEMIIHIFTKYPPKNKTKQLPSSKGVMKLSNKELKNLYFKTKTLYYPDKNILHGDKWVVLCSEITIYLNKIRDSFHE